MNLMGKRILISLFGFSLLITGVSGFLVLNKLASQDGPFIIHFDSSGVVDIIAGANKVSSIFASAGFMILINSLLAYILYKKEFETLTYIFLGSSLFISILAFLASNLIISLN
ncbi:MAG: hypothetical protein HYR95_02845 [Candidatus Colwellbacteria bacterium]|nr:hypothetical protein [Candidatus Colwellbacteria bacterium]